MVAVQYSSESKPILTIADAIKANSFYPYPGEGNVMIVGDANGELIQYYVNKTNTIIIFCIHQHYV